jgi:sugar/nucleoside kinase (ribokinase family)
MTGQEDPMKAAEALLNEGVGLVIITMGERGLLAQGAKVRSEMPALKVSVMDPSGAGDAFCAGMIFGLVKRTDCTTEGTASMSPEVLCDILLEGAAAGAACVTGVGATTAVTRENIDRLLREQASQTLLRTRIVAQ